jgi:hypothetical protein
LDPIKVQLPLEYKTVSPCLTITVEKPRYRCKGKADEASTLFPHPSPGFPYRGGAVRVKKAPKGDRMTKFVASADAAASAPNTSIKYVCTGIIPRSVSKPIMNVPIMGTIQWTL